MQQEHHYIDYDHSVLATICGTKDEKLKECYLAFKKINQILGHSNYKINTHGKKMGTLIKELEKYLDT